MLCAQKQKLRHARLRARRTRVRLHGTATRPRLSVKRSLRHIYAQLIDDDQGRTLAAVNDQNVERKGSPVDRSYEVGVLLAKKARDLGIAQVVFDRGPYRYHGRVAAVAQGARDGGLSV